MMIERKTEVIQIRITPTTKERIRQLGSERGMSPADWVRFLIDREIERKEKQPKK